jgi:hypothetical protein
MTHKVSHVERDRPVYSGSRRVPGLFERRRADGTIVYEARVRLAGTRTRLLLDARNKTAAIAELEALRVDRRRGVPARTGSLVPTLNEVTADWLAVMELRAHHRDPRKRRSPRTVRLYKHRMEAHVLPTLGMYPIDELTVSDLRRLVDKLGRKLAPSTVTAVLNQVSALYRYAVKQEFVEHNIVRDLDRDDRPGAARLTEPRYLSADEVTRLLGKMTDTFRPVAATCAYPGLRISETLGLTWADVDFKAKQINVCRQLDDDGSIRQRHQDEGERG